MHILKGLLIEKKYLHDQKKIRCFVFTLFDWNKIKNFSPILQNNHYHNVLGQSSSKFGRKSGLVYRCIPQVYYADVTAKVFMM